MRPVASTQGLADKERVKLDELVAAFCVSKTGDAGDYYLGFTNVEPFISHLKGMLDTCLPAIGAKKIWRNEPLYLLGPCKP